MTDHTTAAAGETLDQALTLGSLGYKIIPVPKGEKFPKGLAKWQERATDDADQITDWWGTGEAGIGWAMGRQPNGQYLVAIDVDVAGDKDGKAQMEALIREFGLKAAFGSTTSQRTGSGGFHFIFFCPPGFEPVNGRLDDHIDIRGEGGFIVIAPSIHPNGEAYRWAKTPWDCPPSELPAAIVGVLTAEPEPVPHREPTKVAHLLSGDTFATDESPMEYLNRTFDGFACLLRLGWKEASRRGEESQMVRPGKEVREGTGGTYHHDTGIFNVYTTGIAPDYGWVGKSNRDGSLMLLRADLWMVENGYRDVSAASSVIRKMMPKRAPASAVPMLTAEAGDEAEAAATPHLDSLNLPDEFWEARPMLAHIKQAAWSRGESPDSTFAAVITRYATIIPTTLLIPPMVGAPATFDHLSVTVGASSGGKSATMSIAKDLWRGPTDKEFVWDIPAPNGEGLVSSFFEMKSIDEGGKKVMQNVKTKNAVHFSVDEAMSLIQAGGQRQGTTIASVLCAAWAGQNPGQTNASVERRRVGMDRFTFRMAGMMSIQTSLGHNLLTPEWIEQGLSGRMLFLCTDEPQLPKPSDWPSWPGRLELPRHEGATPEFPRYLDYHPDIIEHVREAHWLKKTGRAVVAPIDGHLNLLRLKVSGILALMDGRTEVSLEDWKLTEMVLDSHLAIRTSMIAVAKQARYDENVTKATASGHFDAVRQEATDEVYLKRAKQQIMRRLQAGPKDKQGLRDGMSTGDVKKQLGAAITDLLDEGLIAEDGKDYKLA